jgi:hypothetical protein
MAASSLGRRSREDRMKRRDFNRIALGIVLSLILANTVFAHVTGQTESNPMAAVRKYIDAFNKGDAAGMAATFAVPGSIIDGMAPHLWQGPTAAQDWYRDVLIEGKTRALQSISSLWASHCTTTLPATAHTWSFLPP